MTRKSSATGVSVSVSVSTSTPFGVYSVSGSGDAAGTMTAAEDCVFNGFTFDFEPDGVTMTPPA